MKCFRKINTLLLTLLLGLCFGGALFAGGSGETAVKEKKTLIVLSSTFPRHFNTAVQSGFQVAFISTQIFASPLRFDANWNPQPYLAESWEIAKDGLSMTLNLVKNARFHDGKPVTSEDVAFSIMTIKAKHNFQTMLAPVTRVDTPDKHTAVIRFSKPHPAIFLALSPPLCPILPKHIYDDGQDIMNHPRNLDPIGSGPYKFVKYVKDQFVELAANKDFFIADRPKLERIVVKYATDASSRLMILQRGEADMEVACDAAQNLLQFQKIDSLAMTREGYSAIGPLEWLDFNLHKPPFNDVNVRKAIAYALDRDYLVEEVYSGLATPATGPFAPGSQFWTNDLDPYNLDIAKAEKMLDAAGYPKKADGTRFSATIDFEPNQVHRTCAEYIKAQLSKIGVQIELRTSPDFATWAKRVGSWEYDLTVNNLYNWGDPVIGVHRSYMTENIKHAAFTNHGGYSNPKVDELLTKAGSEMNVDKRKALYHEFAKIVNDELPVYPFFANPFHTVYKKNVRNLTNSIWGVMSPLDTLYFAAE